MPRRPLVSARSARSCHLLIPLDLDLRHHDLSMLAPIFSRSFPSIPAPHALEVCLLYFIFTFRADRTLVCCQFPPLAGQPRGLSSPLRFLCFGFLACAFCVACINLHIHQVIVVALRTVATCFRASGARRKWHHCTAAVGTWNVPSPFCESPIQGGCSLWGTGRRA